MGNADNSISRCAGRAVTALSHGFATPLAGILTYRWAALGLVLLASLQCILVACGATAWTCLVRSVTGIPCPSCGISRACAALLQGRFSDALHLHAFAYGVPVLFLVLCAGGVLPEGPRQRLVALVARLERRTAFTLLIALGFFAYYAVRVTFFRSSYLVWVCG